MLSIISMQQYGNDVLMFITHFLTSCLIRETNLKVRQALPDTANFGDDPIKLSSFNGKLNFLKLVV